MPRRYFRRRWITSVVTIFFFRALATAQSTTGPFLPTTALTRPSTTQRALTRPATQSSFVRRIPLDQVSSSLVTLNFNAPDPSTVFGALVGQAHLSLDGPSKLMLDQDSNHLPDVDLNQISFWQALVTLSEHSPYVFKGFGPDSAVILAEIPAGVTRPPAAVAGPFMVTINHIETNLIKSVDFVGRGTPFPGNRYNAPPCSVSLYASAEPRLKVLRWFVDSVDCETDTGKKLETMPFGGLTVASGMVNSGETQVRFDTQVQGATSISRMRLSARFVVVEKRYNLEILKPLEKKEATFQLQGFRVVFHGITRMGSTQYSCALTVNRDDHDPAAWQNLESSLSGFPVITDAQNRRLMMSGGSRSYNGTEMRTNFTFNRTQSGAAGEPAKLSWSFPSETTEVVVPLEFRNVPLP